MPLHRGALLTAAAISVCFQITASQLTPYPLPTPAPTRVRLTPDDTVGKLQSLISDIASAGDDLLGDISTLGSIAEAIATSLASLGSDPFQNFPDPGQIQSSLGLNDNQVSTLPTQVLNLGNYGNHTDKGWNLRFRSFVYKQPSLNDSQLDDIANKLITGTKVQDLPPSEANQARNVTAGIAVAWPGQQNVTYRLSSASSCFNQNFRFPEPTTEQGDIDEFYVLNSTCPAPGNTTEVQKVSVYVEGASLGNATSYLVPNQGLTIISDIDDILRVTKIWQPEAGLINNTFVNPFQAWMNMPDIYANWSRSIPGVHFHYLTTTPEQITRPYMDFIFKTYPGGSFDTRPQNFSDVSETLQVRKFLLEKIFRTFPQRKFVLVADTSNPDVMSDYPAMATEFPGQVQCILLRNTSETDSSMIIPYNTKGFQNLQDNSYMFFNVPNDLANLGIENGHCLNASIPQNKDFGIHNLPKPDSAASRVFGSGSRTPMVGTAFIAIGLSFFL